jgi:hypothetical protein
MNEDAMSGIVHLTKEELLELTREVKETIAYPDTRQQKAHRNFTAAQLWFRRRYMRSASKWIRK